MSLVCDYNEEDVRIPQEICNAIGPDDLRCERKTHSDTEHASTELGTLVKW